jgi:CHASE3 domain sensor protein
MAAPTSAPHISVERDALATSALQVVKDTNVVLDASAKSVLVDAREQSVVINALESTAMHQLAQSVDTEAGARRQLDLQLIHGRRSILLLAVALSPWLWLR